MCATGLADAIKGEIIAQKDTAVNDVNGGRFVGVVGENRRLLGRRFAIGLSLDVKTGRLAADPRVTNGQICQIEETHGIVQICRLGGHPTLRTVLLEDRYVLCGQLFVQLIGSDGVVVLHWIAFGEELLADIAPFVSSQLNALLSGRIESADKKRQILQSFQLSGVFRRLFEHTVGYELTFLLAVHSIHAVTHIGLIHDGQVLDEQLRHLNRWERGFGECGRSGVHIAFGSTEQIDEMLANDRRLKLVVRLTAGLTVHTNAAVNGLNGRTVSLERRTTDAID